MNKIMRKICIILLMSCLILCNLDVSYADKKKNEWDDEEAREEAWMTYLLTDWPIKELKISYSGINYTDTSPYSEEYDALYTPLIEEMLDGIDGSELADQSMYAPQDYVEILKFICAYSSYFVKNCSKFDGGWLYKDGKSASKFELNSSVYETKTENGHNYLHYPYSNPILWHDENDIAYNQILLGKTIPSNLNAHEAQIYSLKTLYKELISHEMEEMSVAGDIYKSDETLAGMLIKIYCPNYPRLKYDSKEFQSHIAQMCHDTNIATGIQNGTVYPWLYNMGFVNFATTRNDGSVVHDPYTWGVNFGDEDLDGTAEHFVGGYDDGTTKYNYSLYDPSYLASVTEKYTSAKIEYTCNDFKAWGNHIDFGDFDKVEEKEIEEDQKEEKTGGKKAKTKGEKVVAYAKRFVGNPYVYGGTSLTKGADCSGFVQSVYAHFGIHLERTAQSQANSNGKTISESDLKPGDLLFYGSSTSNITHVTMYAGNNEVVHASNEKNGIMISKITYRKPIKFKRIIN